MAHESNWASNVGSQNPNNSAADFQRGGMSGTQAAEAAAAAARARGNNGK